ncbi:MAG: tail fiber domain-containing protein [Lachnospiraceae bacterium]|jgi:hypothetical protein
MAWFKSGYKQTDTKYSIVTFNPAEKRENINSGEKHKTIFGKIAKYFSDLKPVAFTGSYNDLQDKPSNLAPAAHRHRKSDITDFPSSLPASDVYSWAKASSKPSYTAGEVGALPISGGTVTGELNINGTSTCNYMNTLRLTSQEETGGGRTSIYIDGNRVRIGHNTKIRLRIDNLHETCTLTPDTDTAGTIGISYRRWNQIYAVNGAISTSDRNEKKEISYIGTESGYDTCMADEQLIQLILGLKPVVFKRKGGESGRPHHGIIAQDFEKLMEDLGLHDHAAFIKSPKTKEIEVINEDGRKEIKTHEIPGEYIYGIRYEEVISDVIRFSQIMYDKLDNLEDIIQKQEEKITSLEEKLSQM